MNTAIKIISIGLSALTLSSCGMVEETSYRPVYTYNINPAYYEVDSQYYQGGYRSSSYLYEDKKQVNVPDSYHVGQTRSPLSFKEVDRTWVKGQNSQGYTIEISDGDNPSQVAQTLYKAPKNERMGQVKYQRDGKVYYKGLYGSYDSPEAAKKALDALPADIKQNAGVKNWGTVKSAVGDE